MGKFLKFLGVSAIGVATAALTAVAVSVFDNLTGFNLFTFGIWIVVPVGALLVGAAAASGYYFGCKYLQLRPGFFLILQMVAVAAATNVFIYYLEYQQLVLDGGRRASDYIAFVDYMDVLLTHQEMRIGRGAGVSTGELGEFGYWLALIDFVGFLLGGLWCVLVLLQAPTCKPCKFYYRRRAKKERYFATSDEASGYYDGLFQIPVDAPEFAEKSDLGLAKPPEGHGTLRMATTLFECPKCKAQMWRDEVSIWNGRDWKDVNDLERAMIMPAGVDMTPILRKRALPS